MMQTHKLQKVTSILFMAIICSAGIVQTVTEVTQRKIPQALELFQQVPNEKNLRSFENRLKSKSIVANLFRPWAQYSQFMVLGDAGEKALLGHDDWLFYRPAYNFLTQRDPDSTPPVNKSDPLPVIISFHKQLKSRGIHLLVIPVPNKVTIHPEMLTQQISGDQIAISYKTQKLIEGLEKEGVGVVNLFEAYGEAKQQSQPFYMARDTHWSPTGIKFAASIVRKHIKKQQLISGGENNYIRQTVSIDRYGDLLEMLKVRQIEKQLGSKHYHCDQVVEKQTEKIYRDDPDSEILVIGDSFLRVFEREEPLAAGFISQLAYELQQPLTSIINDGGGATLVRQELAHKPNLLKGKKLVIWEFVERDIQDPTEGWKDVLLPFELVGE